MKWLFLHKAQTGENNYYNLIQLKNLFISSKFTPLSLLSFFPLFLPLLFSLCKCSKELQSNLTSISHKRHSKSQSLHGTWDFCSLIYISCKYTYRIGFLLVCRFSLPYCNQYKFFPFQKKHTTFSVLKENLLIIMINSVYHVFDRIS